MGFENYILESSQIYDLAITVSFQSNGSKLKFIFLKILMNFFLFFIQKNVIPIVLIRSIIMLFLIPCGNLLFSNNRF